jgi:RP/EB family microtubule-associated protein
MIGKTVPDPPSISFPMSRTRQSSRQLIGRTNLLEWVNRLLTLKYKKIEDLSNGAAFCQIIDSVNPGSVSLSRVNFCAHLEHDCLENLKVLQEAFTKNHLTEPVDIAALARGHYTASLHLLQFLYSWYHQTDAPPAYDGPGRRAHFHCREPSQRETKSGGVPILNKSLKKKPILSPITPIEPAGDLKRVAAGLQRVNVKLQEDIELMTEERDFYYDKLRKVEEFCQDNAAETAYRKILDILYETDEKNGFVRPDDVEDLEPEAEEEDV